MAWHKSTIKSSLFSLLGVDATRLGAGRVRQLEQVRTAMLQSLGATEGSDFFPLERRVRNAKDVQTLWYLRADLMAALANREGESAARAQLDHITQLFQGLLPRSLMARPNNLRG